MERIVATSTRWTVALPNRGFTSKASHRAGSWPGHRRGRHLDREQRAREPERAAELLVLPVDAVAPLRLERGDVDLRPPAVRACIHDEPTVWQRDAAGRTYSDEHATAGATRGPRSAHAPRGDPDRARAVAPRERRVRRAEPAVGSAQGRPGGVGEPEQRAGAADRRDRVQPGSRVAGRASGATQRRRCRGDRSRVGSPGTGSEGRCGVLRDRRARRDRVLPGRGRHGRQPFRRARPAARPLVDRAGPVAERRSGRAPRRGHRPRVPGDATAPAGLEPVRGGRGERAAPRLVPPVSGLGRVRRQPRHGSRCSGSRSSGCGGRGRS